MKEKFKSLEEFLETPGCIGQVVVYKKPFEANVGEIKQEGNKHSFMLTEDRIRAFVVLVSPYGDLLVTPYHTNIEKFDHLEVIHNEDPKLVEGLLQIFPDFSSVKGPYEKSSFALVNLAGDEVKENEKALKLRKHAGIVNTPGRDEINLEHQNQLRKEIAELTAELLVNSFGGEVEDNEIEF